MNDLARLIDEAADELRRENDYYDARAQRVLDEAREDYERAEIETAQSIAHNGGIF